MPTLAFPAITEIVSELVPCFHGTKSEFPMISHPQKMYFFFAFYLIWSLHSLNIHSTNYIWSIIPVSIPHTLIQKSHATLSRYNFGFVLEIFPINFYIGRS